MSMWFSGMSDYRVRCNLEAMSIFLSLFLFSLQVFYHFFLFRLLIELLAIQKERAIDNQSASFIFRSSHQSNAPGCVPDKKVTRFEVTETVRSYLISYICHGFVDETFFLEQGL